VLPIVGRDCGRAGPIRSLPGTRRRAWRWPEPAWPPRAMPMYFRVRAISHDQRPHPGRGLRPDPAPSKRRATGDIVGGPRWKENSVTLQAVSFKEGARDPPFSRPNPDYPAMFLQRRPHPGEANWGNPPPGTSRSPSGAADSYVWSLHSFGPRTGRRSASLPCSASASTSGSPDADSRSRGEFR